MTTRHTIGRLWARYLEAREKLEGGEMAGPERAAAQRGVNGLRDRLVVNYSPLVKYVAGRVRGRMTYPLELEDLISWGLCGLLDAVETFDPGRGAKFESYAISKIRWAILDEMRKADPLPRRARSHARRVEHARGELAQRLGRAPAEEEVARELGVVVAEHRAFLDRCARARVGSLELGPAPPGAPGGHGGAPLSGGLYELVADGSAADPEAAAERSEVRARLVEAIGTLGEKERAVTTFYFYDGLTLREIGGALNLTEGRISQILRRSLEKLREALADGPLLSERP